MEGGAECVRRREERWNGKDEAEKIKKSVWKLVSDRIKGKGYEKNTYARLDKINI